MNDNTNQEWAKDVYDAVAEQVAEELYLLKKILFEEGGSWK